MTPPNALKAWLDVLLSSAGPRATVRHVLHTASRFMDREEPRTFVGIRRLARDTGLSTETVTDVLREAETAGWIERSPFRKGARREIVATLPPCGESGQSLCGESGQSLVLSVRAPSGTGPSSVRIQPANCAVDPDKPSSTSSDHRPARAHETHPTGMRADSPEAREHLRRQRAQQLGQLEVEYVRAGFRTALAYETPASYRTAFGVWQRERRPMNGAGSHA